MHSLNGSCQTTTSSTSSSAINNNNNLQQNGGGGGAVDSSVETLHSLTYNNNSNNHSTMHYNSLKNSDKCLLNGHQNHLNNSNQTQTFTPGQRDILRLIGQHLRYLGLS